MTRIFSNGPSKDFVINPFERLIEQSQTLYLAAPYFTRYDAVESASLAGKTVHLLIGLNASTSPEAVAAVHGLPNLTVRYLTHRFHAKMFVFDDAALLGSANLTDGGMLSNREAVICLDEPQDLGAIEELRGLFLELWSSAEVLTDQRLQIFKRAYAAAKRPGLDPDSLIEQELGRAEPSNVNVDSWKFSRQRLFMHGLQALVYEQYRPAFREVTRVLETRQLRRQDLEGLGAANETNRFLNWLRLTYIKGDDAWRGAPLRNQSDREQYTLHFGREWKGTDDTLISAEYWDWLEVVTRIFGTRAAIASASKDDIIEGLMSLHAFSEQYRFVKGGRHNLAGAFWTKNQDVEHVRKTLIHLLHDSGDFIERLHDVLYDPKMKVEMFALFSALELFGTVKPEECPPLNGRMAKALRFLGFDVRGA